MNIPRSSLPAYKEQGIYWLMVSYRRLQWAVHELTDWLWMEEVRGSGIIHPMSSIRIDWQWEVNQIYHDGHHQQYLPMASALLNIVESRQTSLCFTIILSQWILVIDRFRSKVYVNDGTLKSPVDIVGLYSIQTGVPVFVHFRAPK